MKNMDTAHTLYEKFTDSDNPKIIIDSAIEIQRHFSDVIEKEPASETGEELLYLLRGRNEKIEWIVLLLILDSNNEMIDNYLAAIIEKNNELDFKQSQWVKILIEELKLHKSENYTKLFNNAINIITNSIDEKLSAQKEKSKSKVDVTKQKTLKKKSFWVRLFHKEKSRESSKVNVQENYHKEQVDDFFSRMMRECIFVNLKCYYKFEPDKNISIVYDACAVYPTPIQNINELMGKDVDTYWKFLHNDDQTFLFIEINFSKTKFVISSNDKNAIIEFCKSVKSLGFMNLTNDPLFGGVRIPIPNPKVIDDFLYNLS